MTTTTPATNPTTKTPKTHRYVVIRHGSNAENQSCCNRMAVGFVTAKTPKEAWAKAQKIFTFWNNQHCEVINTNRATKADIREAFEEQQYSCNRY